MQKNANPIMPPATRWALPSRLSAAMLAGLAACAADLEPAEPPPAPLPLTVTVSADEVSQAPFLGFGVQWEYEFANAEMTVSNEVWTAHWPEVLRRLDFMRPALLRVMLNPGDYSVLSEGVLQPRFDSAAMHGFERILDYAKRHGICVVFGVWHKPDGVPNLTDPDWPDRLLAPLVRRLRVDKGYDCIRYFNLLNEPSGQRFTFEDWSVAVRNLHAAFVREGVAESVSIVGSDGPGAWDGWLDKIAGDPATRTVVAAYEYHLYAHLNTDKWVGGLLEGRLETDEFVPRRRAVSAADPNGSTKPFFMGEAGIDDGMKGDVQPNRYTFEYGVWMADYAVQSMRAGQAGLIAWYLDDAMHTWGSHGSLGLKGWGFWNSLGGYRDYPAEDFDIRPWFITWSLLCRNFPAGSRVLAVDATGDPSVRVAAARLPNGGGISIVAVSEADSPRTVIVRFPDHPGPEPFVEYRYFADDRPTDADGFPRPATVRDKADPAQGMTLVLPGQGVVFLTSGNRRDP